MSGLVTEIIHPFKGISVQTVQTGLCVTYDDWTDEMLDHMWCWLRPLRPGFQAERTFIFLTSLTAVSCWSTCLIRCGIQTTWRAWLHCTVFFMSVKHTQGLSQEPHLHYFCLLSTVPKCLWRPHVCGGQCCQFSNFLARFGTYLRPL